MVAPLPTGCHLRAIYSSWDPLTGLSCMTSSFLKTSKKTSLNPLRGLIEDHQACSFCSTQGQLMKALHLPSNVM